MSDNPYLERILAEVEAARQDWAELFSGEFRIQEVFDLVGSLVRAAEAIITAPQAGADKHRLVREAFEYFDRLLCFLESYVALRSENLGVKAIPTATRHISFHRFSRSASTSSVGT